MLRWKKLSKNFGSITVGKEYNGEPFYWTAFYYYHGLVIDTGCPHTSEEAVRFMKKMKLDIRAVLLTHFHEDHSGGAHLFQEVFDIDIFAPKKSLKILANPTEVPEYRQIVWGQPEPVKAKPLRRKMKINQVRFTAIDTPGHSIDHVSFLIEQKFFMGDLVANPNPVIIMRKEDYIDLIQSLRKVVDLNFETAYGGHGVFDKRTVDETLKNILNLKKQVNMLHKTGLDAKQIVEKIFPRVPSKVLMMEELSGNEWSRINLVQSLLGMMHKARAYFN